MSNVFVWDGVAKGCFHFKQHKKYNNEREIGKIKPFSKHAVTVHALKLKIIMH